MISSSTPEFNWSEVSVRQSPDGTAYFTLNNGKFLDVYCPENYDDALEYLAEMQENVE